MLASEEPFSKLLLFTRIYGFSDGDKDKKTWIKIVQLAVFLIFFVMCFSLFIVYMIFMQEAEAFAQQLILLSGLIISLVKILNFYFKSTSIMELLNSLTDANEPDERKQLETCLRRANMYFRTTVVITILMIAGTCINPIVTGVFSIPLYFPEIIINSKFHFAINFFLSSGFSLYSTVAIFFLDAFTLCILMVIRGCTKQTRNKFRGMKSNPKGFRQCVAAHKRIIR